jgi:hypothetical protein
MFKSRLDSFSFEMENEYRHPPLYIVLLLFRIIHSGARGESKQRICEEHPCTNVFELIEKSLDSISWLVLFLDV